MKGPPPIENRWTSDALALIGFWVPGVPRPQGSMRSFHHKQSGKIVTTGDNPKTVDWRGDVKTFAFQAMAGKQLLVEVPVFAHLYFVVHRIKAHKASKPTPPAIKKPDVDKLTRAIFDACTGVVWQDDSQVTEEFADKRIAEEFEQPGCWVSIGRRVEYL